MTGAAVTLPQRVEKAEVAAGGSQQEQQPLASQPWAGTGHPSWVRAVPSASPIMTAAPLTQEVALEVLPMAHMGKLRHGVARALPRVSQCMVGGATPAQAPWPAEWGSTAHQRAFLGCSWPIANMNKQASGCRVFRPQQGRGF